MQLTGQEDMSKELVYAIADMKDIKETNNGIWVLSANAAPDMFKAMDSREPLKPPRIVCGQTGMGIIE